MHRNLHSIDSTGQTPAVWDHIELAMSHHKVEEEDTSRTRSNDLDDLQALSSVLLAGVFTASQTTLFG